MPERSSIVVTGASTGIGFAVAERFVQHGWQVFGSVRKQADADRLRSAGMVPLLFDVTDADSIAQAAAEVAEALGNRTLQGLVNNAGLVVGGPMLYLPMDKFRYQMEVNLIGPAIVTQAFAPLLGADKTRTGKPGRIVQMSSVAGSSGFPMLGAYAASKHALEGMSESLRRELLLFGIDVSIIAPGAIVTPSGKRERPAAWSNTVQLPSAPRSPLFSSFSTSWASPASPPAASRMPSGMPSPPANRSSGTMSSRASSGSGHCPASCRNAWSTT